jgi:hypothetical protein
MDMMKITGHVLATMLLVKCVGMPCAEELLSPQFPLEQTKAEFVPNQRKETGTLFFECRVAVCGVGSTVSGLGGLAPDSLLP